jgi:hypothetical protein
MARNRIDVHTHLVPPFCSKDLESREGNPSGWDSPLWPPEDAVTYMDSLEIATGVLSLTACSIEGWAGNERADMARRVNDYKVGLVQRRPDGFGFFATLALPDADTTLTEVGRALDELNSQNSGISQDSVTPISFSSRVLSEIQSGTRLHYS